MVREGGRDDDPHGGIAGQDDCPGGWSAAAEQYKPGHEPGENAIVALNSIVARGHPTRYLAGDRAYSNSKPEKFQLRARALGYDHVLDYRDDELGIRDSYEGA